jgi:hypothetical protein
LLACSVFRLSRRADVERLVERGAFLRHSTTGRCGSRVRRGGFTAPCRASGRGLRGADEQTVAGSPDGWPQRRVAVLRRRHHSASPAFEQSDHAACTQARSRLPTPYAAGATIERYDPCHQGCAANMGSWATRGVSPPKRCQSIRTARRLSCPARLRRGRRRRVSILVILVVAGRWRRRPSRRRRGTPIASSAGCGPRSRGW